MLERCSTKDIRSTLEGWIMDQLDFDDPDIADAVYRVIERRLERQLFLKSM